MYEEQQAPITLHKPIFTVIFLSACLLISYYDRILMVVAAESIRLEFALSDKQLSLLTGAAFMFVYAGTGLLAGFLTDRYPRRYILSFSLVIWSVATFLCGLAQSWSSLLFARAAVGVGEAASTPTGLSLISDLYGIDRRSMAISIFFAGGALGVVVAFTLGSSIIQSYGWRAAFLMAAPPGILLGIVALIWVREPVRGGADRTPPPTEADALRGTSRAGKSLAVLMVGGSLASFATIGMMQWLPVFFLRSHGMSLVEVGWIFGPILGLGTMLGQLSGGWLGSRGRDGKTWRAETICMWTMILVIPALLAALLSRSQTAALFAATIAATIAGASSPNFMSACQSAVEPGRRGWVSGLAVLCSNIIGGAVCPFIVGATSDLLGPSFGQHSLRAALVMSMVFCVGGALAFGRYSGIRKGVN